MSLIYSAKGRAREYSPLALNIYKSCDHGCFYCYGKSFPWRMDNTCANPRENLIDKLDVELRKNVPKEQVLLSFIGDPYCQAEIKFGMTREVLKLFHLYGVPTAILTKGGDRCLRDIGIFQIFRGNDVPLKIGATLTFINPFDSHDYEPGAASSADRLKTLKTLHDAGIRTWASLEPVIDPEQTLALIDASHEFVNEYRVGKWNHDPQADKIDWNAFGFDIVQRLRNYGKLFYIKADLQKYIHSIQLYPEECDMDYLNLKTEGEGKLP